MSFKKENKNINHTPYCVKSSGHFILIDVRMSTQTTVARQLILMSVYCLPFGKDLAFGYIDSPLAARGSRYFSTQES